MEQAVELYRKTRSSYESLTRTVQSLLQEVFRLKDIDVLAVVGRTKSVESFAGKLQRKAYTDPIAEMTDLCGVRVIGYIETDVDRIAAVIRELFDVDPKHSLDKATALSVNQVGYRSLHYVCSVGNARALLPEYVPFAGMKFEVQVRTALQHAWAQIEHDRNYKFVGVLPPALQRRLYLAAGLLEMADREFTRIADDIDRHAAEVGAKTARGELDIPIDSASLSSYLRKRIKEIGLDGVRVSEDGAVTKTVAEEMNAFGITTLQDLQAILTNAFSDAARGTPAVDVPNEVGLLRAAMLYHDYQKYFESAWNSHWNMMPSSLAKVLRAKHGSEFDDALQSHDIRVVDYGAELGGTTLRDRG